MIIYSLRQTITTKYLGPTSHKGSRIAATSSSGIRVIIPWDEGLNDRDNHKEALKTLLKKVGDGWGLCWVGGRTRDNSVIWVDSSLVEQACEATKEHELRDLC